ncbi:MAG: MBL fold metallo-hydrolase [Thermoplasmata archaeon]
MVEIESFIGGGFSSNVFLVKADKNFLVDTGTSAGILQRLYCEVDRIIFTHRHFDHTGGAPKILDSLDLPMYAHPLEAEALRNGDDVSIISRSFGKKMPELPVKDIEDEYCGFRIIHTPGHTDGSICLYHPSEKILISGDTVFPGGGVGRTDLPTGSMSELVNSVKMLTGYQVDSIYPGHMMAVEENGDKHIELSLRNISYL